MTSPGSPPADALLSRAPVARSRIALEKSVTVAAVSLIVIGCAIGIIVPAGLGWDFGNFYSAGQRVTAGQIDDVYHADRPIAGQPTQGAMRFWGAPLSAALFAPLAWLRPEAALIVFKVENVVVLFVALALLYRHGSAFVSNDPAARSSFAALFATMALVYQPFWTVFRVGGQSTPTVLLMLVLALFCFMSSRLRTAALLLVGAAMIKPTLVVMLVFLACVAGPAFAASLLLGGALLGAVSVAILGWPIHLEFLRVAIEGSQLSRPWQFNSSLYVPIENVRLLALTATTAPRATTALLGLVWALKLVVVAIFVIIVRASHRQAWPLPARRHFEFLMGVCFWLLVSQTIWEHYLTLLFIPLVYIVAVRRWFPQRARQLVAAIFVLSLGQNLVLMEFLWTRVDIQSVSALIGIGLFKSGPLLLTLILLWRHRGSLFASYTRPVWTYAVQNAGRRRAG
jgi:hypothetical protein